MIQKATVEITVDTEKQGTPEWCKFAIKGDPKVPRGVKEITVKNYPAVLIAAKIMELFTGSLQDEVQPELFD